MKAQEMTEKSFFEAITIGEAADLIRVSRRHFQKLMADGDGPPTIQLGRRKIIRREALRQWLEAREQVAR
jgi:excisionase family DNA binding protein